MVSFHNWLCLGTADAGIGVHWQKVSPCPRREWQEAQGLFKETLACTSKHPLPLFAPLEIITPKWPISSVCMIFFSHLLKAFPLAHLHFFLLFLRNYLIPFPLYFAVNWLEKNIWFDMGITDCFFLSSVHPPPQHLVTTTAYALTKRPISGVLFCSFVDKKERDLQLEQTLFVFFFFGNK